MPKTTQGFVPKPPDYSVSLFHKSGRKKNNCGAGWVQREEGPLKDTVRVKINDDAIPYLLPGVVITLWPKKPKTDALPPVYQDEGRDELRYEEARRSFEPDPDLTETQIVEVVPLTHAPEGYR